VYGDHRKEMFIQNIDRAGEMSLMFIDQHHDEFD
jgi:hypothetical protein